MSSKPRARLKLLFFDKYEFEDPRTTNTRRNASDDEEEKNNDISSFNVVYFPVYNIDS